MQNRHLPSRNQKALWYQQKEIKTTWHFHNMIAMRVDGVLNPDEIENVKSAFDQLISRHDILSCQFVEENGEVFFTISDARKPYFKIVPHLKSEKSITESLNDITREQMDVHNDSLFQARVVHNGEESYILFWVHHLITDGYSLEILQKEFKTFLNHSDEPLPKVENLFINYCKKENDLLASGGLKDSFDYFEKTLKPKVSPSKIFESNIDVGSEYEDGACHFVFDENTSQQITKFSQEKALTPYNFFLSIFLTTIRRLTSSEEVSMGVFASNRANYQARNGVGYFSNPVVFQNPLDENLSINDLFKTVKGQLLEMIENEQMPYSYLVEKLNPVREIGGNPFFRYVLDSLLFNNEVYDDFTINGKKVSRTHLVQGAATYELLIFLLKNKNQYELEIRFNKNILSEDQVRSFFTAFSAIAVQFVQGDLDKKIKDLELVTPQFFVDFYEKNNATKVELDNFLTLKNSIEYFSKEMPNNLAVHAEGQELTYAELQMKIDQYSKVFSAFGITKDSAVIFHLPKTINFIPMLFAVWNCGGIYIPIDPEYPKERILGVLDRVQSSLLITNDGEALEHQKHIRVVSEADLMKQFELTADQYVNEVHSEQAYIMFTSGSTGAPKGVVINHRSITNLVHFYKKELKLTHTDRVLSMSSISFDVSILEMLMPFTAGASLFLTEGILGNAEAVKKVIVDNKITVSGATPMTWNILSAIAKPDEKFLRALVCGGDAVDVDALNKFAEMADEVCHVYGPTETTVWSTTDVVTKSQKIKKVTIGKPIANTEIYILDKHLKPMPPKVVGEIYIGGIGLAEGYYQDPELTAKKFISHPLANKNGRLYATGDLGYFEEDGNIIFLGRNDNQIKLRGYRIELGEVEERIRSLKEIKDAIVIPYGEKGNYEKLIAYVIDQDGFSLDADKVTLNLSAILPKYMIPSTFISLPAFPVNIRNKIDRNELKKMYEASLRQPILMDSFADSDVDVSEIILGIWSKTLKKDINDTEANFFDLGGSSIMLHTIRTELEKAFDVKVDILQLFINTSVEKISDYVQKIKNK